MFYGNQHLVGNNYISDSIIFTHSDMRRFQFVIFLLAGLIYHQVSAANQLSGLISSDSTQAVPPELKLDSLGRSNPSGTVKGFLDAIAAENYFLASYYLELPDEIAKEDTLAVVSIIQKIEVLLNRSGSLLPINIISNNPEGNTNDGLDAPIEEVGSIVLEGKTIPIRLRQYGQENQKFWKFAPESVQPLITEIDAKEQELTAEIAKDGLLSKKWNGAPLGDWIFELFLAIGSYLLAWLFTISISWLVRLIRGNDRNGKYRTMLRALMVPARLVLAVAFLVYFSRSLGISIVVRQAFSVITLIAMWLALFLFIWLLINALTSLGEDRLRENKQFAGLSAISFFRNTAKFILIVTALLILLNTVGVDVTAGLAALGVGGIALALGAQKTIENIIGGLSVVFDQPVSVGDFCKFGETTGTVEKIGMRSTRIRTTSRTVVTIPNSDFSSRMIENFSKRDLFLLQTKIGLRYETTSDQMRYVLVELRKLLYAHPKVDPNPARVRFLGYGSDSLQVEIYAYTHASDWNDFLGIQEDINLRIAKVVEDSGSGFAFPSQTIYLSRDSGLSESKKAAAEAKVKEWIENGELKIPEFDPETIESLKGKLNYPTKPGEEDL